MNKKSKIKKILAFGSLILLLLIFVIITTKNCKTTKAEEITPNYSTISLYDNNNNLITSKPLEPLINIYNGTYEDLGKTLLIENELINSNEKYTFVIDFNYVGNTRYYTSNFKWICNYKTIAVDYEIKLTFLNGADNETTITYTPYEYFNQKSFLIIPNRIFSGTAELSVPVISLSYSLYPSSNIFYSFIDNTYNGYGEGYARGYNEGYDDGIQYNNNEVYMQGYNFGKEDGYNLGHLDGYDEGYDEGYADGYEQIIEETSGLTINFNQLVQNGNFENTDNWSTIRCSINSEDGYGAIISAVAIDNTNFRIYQTLDNSISGHKILVKMTCKSNDLSIIGIQGTNLGGGTTFNINNNWNTYAFFTQCNVADNFELWINSPLIPDATQTYEYEIKNVMLFDLTEIYGIGNEPQTIEEFNAYFPSQYYQYTTNELVNINYEIGYNDGYNDGEYNGIIQGETHQIERTNFMTELFNSFDAFLNIHLLPNMTIGLLVFIPLMISITWFVVKAFRGGGSD